MKRTLFLFFLLLVGGTLFAQKEKYRDSSLPVEQRIDDLLGRMTQDEKIGQLWSPIYDRKDKGIDAMIAAGRVSMFSVARADICPVEDRNRLQKIAVEKSRLGIPLLFGFDVIHGYKTIYPIPLGLAASWDVDLAREAAAMAAREAWAGGVDMTFSPMVDVGRDPRWGRVSEGSGEDVLMAASFGRAAVEGYQGDKLPAKCKIGACAKHFVGYGAAEGGRDYQFTEISDRTLREVYLPPFKACVDAGAVCVMSAFNDLSGLPSTANYRTIRDILKKEWGFKNFVLSDWDAVVELLNHGVAADSAQAAVRALSAGVDVEMRSNTYPRNLKAALDRKQITQAMIDDAVRRVLRTKFTLGLFDNPYRDPAEQTANIFTADNREVARRAAEGSFVLLKNSGDILPLTDNKIKSLLVMGPWADSRDLYGWWIANGDNNDAVNVFEGVSKAAPQWLTVVEGTNSRHEKPAVALICVGEGGFMFGENNSRHDLRLPFGQAQMVQDMKKMGYRTVVVVFNGRALDLSDVEPWADAILLAWHPGTETGNAVADVLFGKVSPSGKLPVTFPKSSGQIPLYYSMRSSGRPGSKYVDLDDKPLWPFGFGLSYTKFDLSGFALSKATINANDGFSASVNVANTGKMKGKEVVQLYARPLVGDFTQPRLRLIAFKKVELDPGVATTVKFDLKPEQLATLAGDDRTWRVEPGTVEIMVGESSDKLEKIQLTIK